VSPSSDTETYNNYELQYIGAGTDTVAQPGKMYANLLMYQCNVKALLIVSYDTVCRPVYGSN